MKKAELALCLGYMQQNLCRDHSTALLLF